MQDEYNTPRRFVGLDSKVNLFLAAAVLAVLGAVALVSYKQGMFVRHTPVYFYAMDAFGINKGMVVKLFGLPVGSVKTMVITDRGVKVEISIASGYLEHVPKDSRVRLLREGYIGPANLQIIPGADSNGKVEAIVAGEVLEFLPNRGVAELIDEFKNQVAPVLVQLQKAVEDINRPDSDFRQSAVALRVLLSQLPETNLAARKVLRDMNRELLDVGPEARASFSAAARLGAQVEQQLPTITNKLATTLDSLAEAAQQVREQTQKNGEALNQTLSQAPALLNAGGNLVRDGTNMVREGREVIGAARNVWPLSRGIETPSMGTLPVDSFESRGPGRAVPAAP